MASEVTYQATGKQVDAQNYWTISFQLLSQQHITHPRSTKVLSLLLLPPHDGLYLVSLTFQWSEFSLSMPLDEISELSCQFIAKTDTRGQSRCEWMRRTGFIPSNRLTESVVEQWQGIDPSPFSAHQWTGVDWHGNEGDNNCSDQTITLLLVALLSFH